MLAEDIYKSIRKIAPSGRENLIRGLVAGLQKHGNKFGVNTPVRVAAFIGQVAQETDRFATLTEYWQGKGSPIQQTYYRKNGNRSAADGYKYRGRGYMQITGRGNYAQMSKLIYNDSNRLVNNPEILSNDTEIATLAALHYWNSRNINPVADRRDTTQVTKLINGGKTHLAQRVSFTDSVLNSFHSIIGTALTPSPMFGDDLKKKSDSVSFANLLYNITHLFNKK